MFKRIDGVQFCKDSAGHMISHQHCHQCEPGCLNNCLQKQDCPCLSDDFPWKDVSMNFSCCGNWDDCACHKNPETDCECKKPE